VRVCVFSPRYIYISPRGGRLMIGNLTHTQPLVDSFPRVCVLKGVRWMKPSFATTWKIFSRVFLYVCRYAYYILYIIYSIHSVRTCSVSCECGHHRRCCPGRKRAIVRIVRDCRCCRVIIILYVHSLRDVYRVRH